MSIESYQLYEAAKQHIGAKKAASAMNMSLDHFYTLCQPSEARRVAVRDDVERITQLQDVMAAHPSSKPARVMWRLYFDDLFGRTVDRDSGPLNCDTIRTHVGNACKEFGELLAECGPSYDADRITKEACELIAAIEDLVRCAEQSDNTPSPKVTRLSARMAG